MSKYLKLFETTADYTAAESTLVKPNVSLIEETNKVEYNPYIPPQPITYTASAKLNVTWPKETATFGATIKSHTFENGVGTIEFNDYVTKITSTSPNPTVGGVFGNSLTSITIPNSVTVIGNYTFLDCTKLISITIPDSVTSIGQSAFNGCTNLTSITIPNSVTSIGGYAFFHCQSLTSINIPNGITSIGEYTFRDCTNLASITIPDSVTSIGEYAFRDCSNLTSITITDSVTSIGDYAFRGCSKLTSVTVEAIIPPTLGSSVFNNNASGRKIYVPAESVNVYKAASGWSTYASDIEAIPIA